MTDLNHASAVCKHRIETQWGFVTGWVYVIFIGRPYVTHVKIGYTKASPLARLKALQTGCPFPMTLMGFVGGCEVMEQDYHAVLEARRSHGEWFVFDDYCRQVVEDMLSDDA